MQVGDAKEKRNRSGPINEAIGTRYYICDRFTGKLHIERIGAKLNLLPPGNPSARSDMNRLEASAVIPRLEHAAPCQMRQIDLPISTVGVPEPNPVPLTRLNLSWPNQRS